MQDGDAGTAIVPGADGGAAGGILYYGALARRAKRGLWLWLGFGRHVRRGGGGVGVDPPGDGDTDGLSDD
jgi:hypothetical protein